LKILPKYQFVKGAGAFFILWMTMTGSITSTKKTILVFDMWRIFLLFGIAVLFLIAVSVIGRVSEAMQRKRMKK